MVGAVPVIVVLGLDVAVPPEMLVLWPAPDLEVLFHVVVKVSTVEPALTAPVVIIVSPVYGATVSAKLSNVVAPAPGESVYHPVVVANVVCVPPVPPIRVVPV